MRKSLVLFLLLFNSLVEASNTLWNSTPNGKLYVFRAYSVEGNCPSIRKNPLPLVFATKNESGSFEVDELYYCFAIEHPPKYKGVRKCKSGSVQLAFEKATNTYVGKYKFIMSDGASLEGNINAEYCAEVK